MATLYKDLGKDANDLLNKGYVEQERYNWKVELTNSSASGVKITPTISKAQDQPLNGSIKTVVPFRNGFNSTVTFDLKNLLKFEVSSVGYLRNSFKPSLEISTSSENLVNNLKIKQTVDFAASWGGATLGVTIPSTFSSPAYNASLVTSRAIGFDSVGAIGVETDFTSGKDIPLNLATSFITPAVTATIFGNFVIGKAYSSRYGISFYGPVASAPLTTFIGSELQYDSEGKATQLSIGASHKFSSSINVKARINSRGIFGFVYSRKVNELLSLSFLADLNLREASNPNSLRYGVKLTV
eukprot:TRINITY_DN7776_c0_g1_i1.p1 TRINITY_DN7776_c0_g1~~TRINITY_DN7776_c0_g1_i1.p1  ORF type:complete len:306 (+),score=78.45 TRINITY_DN7776_c0_g1_i1:26-919(+)